MKKQTNMFQVKEQGNTSEKDLNETEISDLTWWKYKRMVIKIFTKLKRKMEGQSENLKTEAENKRKHQIEVTELKNTMTEMENITWRFNSRPDEARKKRVTALNDRALELTQSQQQTEKKKEWRQPRKQMLLFSRCVQLFENIWTATCQAFLSFTIFQSLLKLTSIESMMPPNHLILSPSSPPALNLSQHQSLFQWVGSSHQAAKILELQFQHQSFQWITRINFL